MTERTKPPGTIVCQFGLVSDKLKEKMVGKKAGILSLIGMEKIFLFRLASIFNLYLFSAGERFMRFVQ